MSEKIIITAAMPTKPTAKEEELALLSKELTNVREEVIGSPYIKEALKVLPTGGYRSAIGCYWNAVVDDLRKKFFTGASICLIKKCLLKGSLRRMRIFRIMLLIMI